MSSSLYSFAHFTSSLSAIRVQSSPSSRSPSCKMRRSRVKMCENLNSVRTFGRSDVVVRIVVPPPVLASSPVATPIASEDVEALPLQVQELHAAASVANMAEATAASASSPPPPSPLSTPLHTQSRRTQVLSFRDLPRTRNLDGPANAAADHEDGVAGWDKLVFTDLRVATDGLHGCVAVARDVATRASRRAKLVVTASVDAWDSSFDVLVDEYDPASTTSAPWIRLPFVVPCAASADLLLQALAAKDSEDAPPCEAHRLELGARLGSRGAEAVCTVGITTTRVHVPDGGDALAAADEEARKWCSRSTSTSVTSEKTRVRAKSAPHTSCTSVYASGIQSWKPSPTLPLSLSTRLVPSLSTMLVPSRSTSTARRTSSPTRCNSSRSQKWIRQRRRGSDDTDVETEEEDNGWMLAGTVARSADSAGHAGRSSVVEMPTSPFYGDAALAAARAMTWAMIS